MDFKRAVDEEVKSQRMKTELITNVSHDLKTPLTAIIYLYRAAQGTGYYRGKENGISGYPAAQVQPAEGADRGFV